VSSGSTGPPDGAIGAQDIFALLAQFGHNCNPGWQPNIVVIMTDDQDDTGSVSTMPNTQSMLVAQGTRFTNSFADFPLCCPSRASFLTGQAAHNHGVLDNVPPDGGYSALLPTEANTLPSWLKGVGYTTAHVGRYLNGYGTAAPATHVPPGWDEWFVPPGPQSAFLYFGYSVNDNGTLRSYGSSPADYQTDVLAGRAVEFITAQTGATQPFFLSIAPTAPHASHNSFLPVPAPRHVGTFASHPLPAPPNFNELDLSDKPPFMQAKQPLSQPLIDLATNSFRLRREALLAVDDMVGNIVLALANTGKLDSTIIVFTSDNGFVHGEHRRPLGKGLIYEEEVRVPLLIRGPGVPKGEARAELVNNLDVVATMVEMAETVPGRTLDGRSFVGLLSNSAEPWRTALLVQGINSGMSTDAARMQAVRTENFVYAEHRSATGQLTASELYDLGSDPYQLESQHSNPSYTTIRQTLANLLAPLKTCAGQDCWYSGPVP
jgi:arylsulfatase A-like enzyme